MIDIQFNVSDRKMLAAKVKKEGGVSNREIAAKPPEVHPVYLSRGYGLTEFEHARIG
jgi:hypothetical protein